MSADQPPETINFPCAPILFIEEIKPLDALQKENPSLHRILMGINELDDAIEDVDSDAQINLLENGKAKVDGYKAVIDGLEMQEAYYKEQAAMYEAKARAAKSAIARIKKNLLFALTSNQFTMFTGNLFVVKIQRAAPAVETNLSEPTQGMKIRYDKFVKTKYEWDKKAIAEALKAEDPQAKEIANFRETLYPKFSPIAKEKK